MTKIYFQSLKGRYGLFVFVFLFVSIIVSAQIPRTISYQGIYTDGSGLVKPDGDYTFTFSLYKSAEGGDPIWSETKLLSVEKGLFFTALGDTDPFPDSIRFNVPYWLGISPGGAAELAPRIAFSSTAYSLSSERAERVETPLILTDSLNSSQYIMTVKNKGEGHGIQGISQSGYGTVGIALATTGGTIGVVGNSFSPSGYAVYGYNPVGTAVFGTTSTGTAGVHGETLNESGSGVEGFGYGANAAGVFGLNTSGPGLWGRSSSGGAGVYGESESGMAIHGVSTYNNAIYGVSTSGLGVYGVSSTNGGVLGQGWVGVQGNASGTQDSQGVRGDNGGKNDVSWAGLFNGRVGVFGNLAVYGTLTKSAGSFKIDHPLDPANKYLYHSFVESPDMKNVYDGVVTTDGKGEAVVKLPDWFEALNKDFRYQLTSVGQQAQAWILEEIKNNQFRIKTDKPQVKISWQITGIRHDAYAEKNRIPVEENKPALEKGSYINPESFNIPVSMKLKVDKLPEKIETSVQMPKREVPVSDPQQIRIK
jgi:hypothetical protein